MITNFRDMPIKRKVTGAILGTATLALLLACFMFVSYELVTFRESMQAKLAVLADVLGTNSTAALEFRNQDDAAEILQALTAEPEVLSAALYTSDDAYFAG